MDAVRCNGKRECRDGSDENFIDCGESNIAYIVIVILGELEMSEDSTSCAGTRSQGTVNAVMGLERFRGGLDDILCTPMGCTYIFLNGWKHQEIHAYNY